jgi:hypothetical protein
MRQATSEESVAQQSTEYIQALLYQQQQAHHLHHQQQYLVAQQQYLVACSALQEAHQSETTSVK